MDGRTLAIAALCLTSVGCFDPSPVPGGPEDEDMTTQTGGGAEDGDSTAGDESGGEDPSVSDETGGATDGPGETGEPGEESGGPQACDGGLCLSVPEGWSGPVVLAADADACSGAAVEFTAGGDLTVPASDCGCDCGDAAGVECSDHTLTAWGTDSTCGDQRLEVAVDPDTVCQIYTEDPDVLSFPQHWTLTGEVSGGSCEETATVDIPPASYGTTVAACSVDELPGECDDGQCYEGDTQCVWQPGDHACPAGFDERELYFRGEIDDTRGCTSCECGEPTGACEGSFLRLTSGYYCNGDPFVVDDVCTEHCIGNECETYALSGGVVLGDPVAECAPSGGEPTGEAVGQDPVTVCCQ